MATKATKRDFAQSDLDEGETEDLVPEPAARQPIELALSAGDAGERLDKALARHVSQFSRSRLQQWIEAGFVTIDGQPAQVKMTVHGDETVRIEPQAAPEDAAFLPEAMALPIVYEDAQLIVIDKPAGLVVHPAAGNWSGTLLNGLLHHFPPIAGVPRAGIVHRLDKDTSGLLVVAKTLEAQTDLVRQLQARSVHREYLALVWGAPHLKGKVDVPIGRHPRDRLKMAALTSTNAKPAVTHFERLAEGTLEQHRVSLIRCRLETGRTHQIRVHLQSIGHPLVGDTTYGKQHLARFFHRQALHAFRLGLVHPHTGDECVWQAPLPDDFADLLRQAGIDATTFDEKP
ncbi:MAG: RluA family pseudouridine synthase [Burkholderiaceae bacterium]|nr:RluA family pseudouridine synthase [Burkholderiaceae bacterium]